jgi:hypothetical protein
LYRVNSVTLLSKIDFSKAGILDGKVPFETFFGKDLGGYLQDQVLFVLPQRVPLTLEEKGEKFFLCPPSHSPG